MNDIAKAAMALAIAVNTQLLILQWTKQDIGIYEAYAMIVGISFVSGALYGIMAYLLSYRNYLDNKDECIAYTPLSAIGGIVTALQNILIIGAIAKTFPPDFMTKMMIVVAGFAASFAVASITYIMVIGSLFRATKLSYEIKGDIEKELAALFVFCGTAVSASVFVIGACAVFTSERLHLVLFGFYAIVCVMVLFLAPMSVRHALIRKRSIPKEELRRFGKHEASAVGMVAAFFLFVLYALEPESRLDVITHTAIFVLFIVIKELFDMAYNRAVRKLKNAYGELVIEVKN